MLIIFLFVHFLLSYLLYISLSLYFIIFFSLTFFLLLSRSFVTTGENANDFRVAYLEFELYGSGSIKVNYLFICSFSSFLSSLYFSFSIFHYILFSYFLSPTFA